MKNVFTILSVAAGVAVSAQNSKTLYIEGDAIISNTMANQMDVNNIEAINIYKSANGLTESLRPYSPFTKLGIIEITPKKYQEQSNIISATFLNKMHGMSEDNEVIINSLKVSPKNINIYQDAISNLAIIKEDGNSYLNIEINGISQPGKPIPIDAVEKPKRPIYLRQIK